MLLQPAELEVEVGAPSHPLHPRLPWKQLRRTWSVCCWCKGKAKRTLPENLEDHMFDWNYSTTRANDIQERKKGNVALDNQRCH